MHGYTAGKIGGAEELPRHVKWMGIQIGHPSKLDRSRKTVPASPRFCRWCWPEHTILLVRRLHLLAVAALFPTSHQLLVTSRMNQQQQQLCPMHVPTPPLRQMCVKAQLPAKPSPVIYLGPQTLLVLSSTVAFRAMKLLLLMLSTAPLCLSHRAATIKLHHLLQQQQRQHTSLAVSLRCHSRVL